MAAEYDSEFERYQHGYYTPARVRRTLERWHEADAKVSDPDVRIKRHKRPAADPEKNRILPRADVRWALVQLSQLSEDPVAAATIHAYYLDLRTAGNVGMVAAEDGCHEVTVYRRINRGIRRISQLLCGRSRDDDEDLT